MTKRHITYSVLVIQRGSVYTVFIEKSSKNPADAGFYLELYFRRNFFLFVHFKHLGLRYIKHTRNDV